MKITILAVGRLKESYLTAGVQEYTKRLGAYAQLSIREFPDEKAPEQLSSAEREKVLEKEGERLLKALETLSGTVISLEIEGEMLDSVAFSEKLSALALHGESHLIFLIGGSNGLSPAVREKADLRLSFSRMTFPHQLMRLILLEQLYRAFKIARHEPYHK